MATNPTQAAAELLNRTLRGRGVRITYTRGEALCYLTANIGQTRSDQPDPFGAGLTVVARTRDYLIESAELVLDGEPATPAAGDRIAETAGDKTHTYEVTPPAGEPAWRYCDPFRTRIRVHTKHVSTT